MQMRHLDDGTLQEWLDAERSGMDAAQADAVQRHLRECAPCSARADGLDALGHATEALLRVAPVEPAAPVVYSDVVARAEQRSQPRRVRRSVAVGWAATVTLALGAGWLTNEVVRSDRVSAPATRPATPARTPADFRAAPPVSADVTSVGGGADAPAPEAGTTPTDRSDAPADPTPFPTTDGPPEASVVRRTEAIVVPPATPPALPGSTARASVRTAIDATPVPVAVPAEVEGTNRTADAPAAPRYLIGRVTDEDGRPLEGVQVYLANTGIGALTVADGTYRLALGDRRLASTAVLRAELIGFSAGRQRLAASGSDSLSADFQLTQQAIALESIVVTGTASPAERRAVGNTVAPLASAAERAAIEAAGWRRSNRNDAETRMGFPLLLLPGAPITSVRVRQVDERWAVRVVQRLASGDEVTLTQVRGGPVIDAGAGLDGRTAATVLRGELSVSGAALLPLDSLHALLERIR
jgi:hypothetical protein